MSTVIRHEAIVGPDGTIEVRVPELLPGQRVEVMVVPAHESVAKRSATEILAEAPGHLEFKTPEEVDAYLREERESWGD